MVSTITPGIIKVIRTLESALISKNYMLVSFESGKGRLSAKEIEDEINTRKGKITPAPDNWVQNLQVVRVRVSTNPKWMVDYDLWFDNKHSDLTLSLEITQLSTGDLQSFILDLHVL